MPRKSKVSRAAAELGRRGGESTSEAKAAAARANGAKGGRPMGRPKTGQSLVGTPGTRSDDGRRMVDERGKVVQTPEYIAWTGARHRCNSTKSPKYKDYGGRGITFCERWSSFENFYSDMGPKPTKWAQLGRIDNDGPYSPENCRWESIYQQAKARRPNPNAGEWARVKALAHASLNDQIIWQSWAKAAGMSMKDFARSAIEEKAARLGVTETEEWKARKHKVDLC